MDLEIRAKLAIYEHFAAVGGRPSVDDIAASVGVGVPQVRVILGRLRAQRVMVLRDGPSAAAPGQDGQLWQIAREWYSTRLQPESRRPQPAEMRRILARLGLVGDFWDPQSDVFGGAEGPGQGPAQPAPGA